MISLSKSPICSNIKSSRLQSNQKQSRISNLLFAPIWLINIIGLYYQSIICNKKGTKMLLRLTLKTNFYPLIKWSMKLAHFAVASFLEANLLFISNYAIRIIQWSKAIKIVPDIKRMHWVLLIPMNDAQNVKQGSLVIWLRSTNKIAKLARDPLKKLQSPASDKPKYHLRSLTKVYSPKYTESKTINLFTNSRRKPHFSHLMSKFGKISDVLGKLKKFKKWLATIVGGSFHRLHHSGISLYVLVWY